MIFSELFLGEFCLLVLDMAISKRTIMFSLKILTYSNFYVLYQLEAIQMNPIEFLPNLIAFVLFHLIIII